MSGTMGHMDTKRICPCSPGHIWLPASVHLKMQTPQHTFQWHPTSLRHEIPTVIPSNLPSRPTSPLFPLTSQAPARITSSWFL